MEQPAPSTRSRASIIYYLIVILVWLVYVSLTIKAPVGSNIHHYHISGLEITIAQTSVMVPLLIVWLIAAVGASHLRRYARLIKGSKDGDAIKLLARGAFMFLIYIMALTIFGAIPAYFVGSKWLGVAVTIKNLAPLLAAFIATALTYAGSVRLMRISGTPVWLPVLTWAYLIPYCVFSALFTLAFFANTKLDMPLAGSSVPAFGLSSSWLLIVYVIPYLVMWFIGGLAVRNIWAYANKVQGSIYRNMLADLAKGLGMVLLFTIVLQVLATMGSLLTNLGLAPILLLVYLLLILDAAGYAFIARGAHKMTKIEVTE